LKFGQQ
jgi:hypothetical protein